MSKPLPGQDALLHAATLKQRAASDPAVSAWVRANAGTGKTHVLVQRILRLFLAGVEPGSILCLTFTKNAAAEMEGRVLDKLGQWATCEDAALAAELATVLARAPTTEESTLARSLFASVIDGAGGLAIMTIHGFCERVLRRYSFEAGVPPAFAVMTEEEGRDALAEAQSQAFATAASGPLRDALTTIVAYAGEADFSKVLKAMLGSRREIAHVLSVSESDDPVDDVETKLRLLFDVDAEDTEESLIAEASATLDARTLRDAIEALSQGSKTDQELAERLRAAARAEASEQRFAALKAALMTQAGEPRKRLMTAKVKDAHLALHDRLCNAQAALVALDEKLRGAKVVTATAALLRLTAEIFSRYEAEKRARGAVDFDDLIDKTLGLLIRAEAADWVLYQLDKRIDHILVDEAQDTSPAQWNIVERLTSDFFSGASAREAAPTIFAVGDEKQSIYGFQGAKPELLAAFSAFYEHAVCEAGLDFRTVKLDLSFRTLSPVLAAVDDLIATLPDLKGADAAPHSAYRSNAGGHVELWAPERGERQDKGSVWEADAEGGARQSPAEALAARIAAQVERWLSSGEMLVSRGRPIEPGDILILLRKRQPMARLLQAALKREGVPVSGADRVALLDELAAMDLLSLAGAMVQPEDDLALAEALKSPLFGFCDDDLFKISFKREMSLWSALEQAGQDHGGNYAQAGERLACWRGLALRSSPYDFFAHVLDAEGGRKAFAERLGPECLEALDEFLNLAEAFGERDEAGLAEFIVSMRRGAAEVKRETDSAAGEVRVMTVHGAKGLEANIVILADACSNRSASGAPIFFIGDGGGAPALPVWAIKGASKLAPIAGEKARLSDVERRELERLLYVAMTRARDRLYVTGFHQGDLPAGCWYETIKTALGPRLEESADFAGRPVWRDGGDAALGEASHGKVAPSVVAPDWLNAFPPSEKAAPILSPSKLLPPGADETDDKPAGRGRIGARAEGVLIHRLLEALPTLPAAERREAATIIASAFSGSLRQRQANEVIECALALLSTKEFVGAAPPFVAEAGIAAALEDFDGARLGVIMGQADRISFGEAAIQIYDYKSGDVDSEGSSLSFQAQLAAYRQALRRLYPNCTVNAAVIDTRTARVLQSEDAALDDAMAQIAGAIQA
jgi:ATP-dependent helicase/nuclease subunit A